ncbi:hypothetical protein RHMOL_Rhmol01G0361500 [Rhododendron molle]|uniref:Uncharacterized protein n=1 Tax=Rhododendron molle TaxID=49168 RepID=A0ACC0Q9V9_RHOML|nr:hypothetical protein RHMOL_Rhmol01G0361500 [Rhododendron molle]
MAADALYNTHVKLLAIDFLSLTPTPSGLLTFTLSSTLLLLTRAETLGVVTTRELKPDRFLKFSVDDGTGINPCILWLNHLTSPYFSRRSPSDVRLIADAAAQFASRVQLGALLRVRGRITGYRGSVQITVSDVVAERDPNAEKIMFALTSIKGIGRRFSNIACKKADIDMNKRAGELSMQELDNLMTIVANPRQFKIPDWFLNRKKDYKDGKFSQVTSNALDMKLRDDLERLKKIRNHRGLRRYWGLRVRGQHTKTTGRRGKTVGVSKKR